MEVEGELITEEKATEQKPRIAGKGKQILPWIF